MVGAQPAVVSIRQTLSGGHSAGSKRAAVSARTVRSLRSFRRSRKALVDLSDPSIDQLADVSAWRFPSLSDLQHFMQIAQREPHGLTCSNESKSIDHRRAVHPITGGGALRLGEEPYLLVEADGRGGDPNPAGDFTYLHFATLPLDLQVHLKVYVDTSTRYGEIIPTAMKVEEWARQLADASPDLNPEQPRIV